MPRCKGLWSVLMGVDDPNLRQDLTLLATAIQVHFPDRAAKERSIVEFMAIRFQWPATRTRRRLDTLASLGVIRSSRDLADGWSKVVEIVDRPHVPSQVSVEMGA